MSFARRAALLVALLVAARASCIAQAASELSPEQRAILDTARQLSIVVDVSGSRWPRTCVYQYIDSSPEEAVAVFTDYERQMAYISSLRKSKISQVLDKRTVEVDYVLDVPIVADEDYTVRDHLSSNDSTNYRVDWTLVRASSTKAIEGSARFERYRLPNTSSDGTLLAYCNLVTPGSRLAGLGFVRNRAVREVGETTKAIAGQVERERASERSLLEQQVRALRSALSR
jgi:hypothetical protein